MAARKHWTDRAVHPSHTWGRDGVCKGCFMAWDWPGARDRCSSRVPKRPKAPRTLEGVSFAHEPYCDMDADCDCPHACAECAGAGRLHRFKCRACAGTGYDLALGAARG